MDDIANTLTPGSTIVFMNLTEEERFRKVVEKDLKLTPDNSASSSADTPASSTHSKPVLPPISPTATTLDSAEDDPGSTAKPASQLSTWNARQPGVKVALYHGDAASHGDLAPLIDAWAFDAFVVLGTAADAELDPNSQDSRVLSISVLVRHLVMKRRRQQGCMKPTHIVAENQIDQTALLALTPGESTEMMQKGKFQYLPDFINTQAIIARAIAQALAFPKPFQAITELFDDTPGAATLMLKDAGIRVPLGEEMTFGAAQMLSRGADERDVLIGYISHQNAMHLGPKLSETITFQEGARLILVSRTDPAKTRYVNGVGWVTE